VVSRFSIRRFAVIGFAASAMVAASAGVASAAPASAQATAPSCVHTSVHTGTITKTFKADNTCSSTQRVRFILARHSDSDCYTLAPNQWVSIQVARIAALSRLDSC
jgi:hypothetical protein